MVSFLFYAVLICYTVPLVALLFYYLTRKAPTGDASIGWAIGLLYMAGLAGVVWLAWLLRNHPAYGLALLGIPIVFLLLPSLRRVRTTLYVWWPVGPPAPPLTLSIENRIDSRLHIKVEVWFGKANSHVSVLYTTFDYYLQPLEKTAFVLTAQQTQLLAHKCRYVTISVFEQVEDEHEGHAFIREIQPCREFYNEPPTAFRSGTYSIVIDNKKTAPESRSGL